MSKRGFTFIQLVLALFILGLSLTPVVMITMQGNRNLRENILYLDALMTATTIISQAKQYSFIYENIGKTISIDLEDNKGFVLPDELFSKTKSSADIIFKKMDKNLVYILVKINYEGKNGEVREILMESGYSLMLNKNYLRAFTTVELMISVSVGFLIILLMSSTFGQNVLNIRESSRLNDLEYGKHFLMKEIYLNLINMNSEISFEDGDINSTRVNFITFKDKKGGKYKKLMFDYHPYKNFGKGIETIYYVDEKNRFVRERDKKVKFLRENVRELNFSYLNRMIYCDGTFYSEKDDKILEREFRFGIFAGYDHIGVKFE